MKKIIMLVLILFIGTVLFAQENNRSMKMTSEIINLEGWGKCLKLSNGKIEVVTTIDLGPRTIGFNLVGGKNVLNPIGKVDPIVVEYGDFYTYGGHRLWHAPEMNPRTYVPDNDPIKYELTDTGAIFYYNFEKETGIAKKYEIILGNDATISVKHTLTNENVWPIECAPWALTIVAPGGRLLIPQEPFIPNTEKLLPARPMVLWNYTDMADKRYTFGTKFVELKNDAKSEKPTKMGFMDKLGWVAYELPEITFVKSFDFIEGAEYTDYGCNVETFTQKTFHEVETVAPMAKLEPKGSVDYTEKWSLITDKFANDDEIYTKVDAFVKGL